VIARVVDHEANQSRAHAPGNRGILSNSFCGQPASADFQLHALFFCPLRQPLEAGRIESVQWQVVAHLKQLHTVLAAFVEQATLVERLRRLMATSANRPTKGVTAEAESRALGLWFVARGHDLVRLGNFSKTRLLLN
jgi:hypothetical protein